jgi:isoleucyl-tRNA synthetase
VAELSELAGRGLTDLDLHRPYVDEITFACPECGSTANRLTPVLDAWFDSGSMPSAQQHFPFEGQDPQAQPPSFPADYICEAIDQTRGWFYSLLAVNTLAFGSTPYENVVCLGHIVDGEGQKMSKSRGNVIDPWHVFNTFGADSLRWYFLSAGQPWSPRRVNEDGIRESTRQTLLTLWNVHSFFATYADLDGWEPGGDRPAPTHALDRWILGELDDTIVEVTAALEDFDAFGGATRIARFVDDLSNWYVRRSRPRFWKSKDPNAYATLHRCLTVTAELLAPFTPFLADELWRSLTGGLSVHAADWPTPSGARDEALAVQVDAVRRLVGLGRSARTDGKVKTRQPLRRALLLHPGVDLDTASREDLESELNVKVAETIEGLGGIVSWTAVPNFRTLGPRLGPKVNEVKAALARIDGGALRQALDEQGWVEVAGERLEADDLEVRAERHGQFALAQEGPWAVALDLELDDELRVEGTARELSRALNDLRKDQGLAIADHITVVVDAPADGRAAAAVAAHQTWIAGEVLADDFAAGDATGGQAIEIDGEAVTVRLTKV